VIPTRTAMWGVWRSVFDRDEYKPPIAVCTSQEAAMAVRGTGYVAEHDLYSHRPVLRGFEPIGDTIRPMSEAEEEAFWSRPLRGMNHGSIQAALDASEDTQADMNYGPGAEYRRDA
jgi:hypothetical protein